MLPKSRRGVLAALLLSVAPLSAQSSGGGGPSPDCTIGRARGAWDLPADRNPGRVRGVLFNVDGVQLAVGARLTPLPLPGSLRGGRFDGHLYRMTSTGPAPRPIAAVHGTYLIGADGVGRYETAIVSLDPGPTGRPRPLGKLVGVFADPPQRGANPVGAFMGRWILCR